MDCPDCRASVPAGKFCIECGAAFERRCDLGQVVGPGELVIGGTPYIVAGAQGDILAVLHSVRRWPVTLD